MNIKPTSATKCSHCGKTTESGTHNGCSECRRVKHTSGRRNSSYKDNPKPRFQTVI